MIASAITPAQYSLLRSENQHSRVRLAIFRPNIIHQTTISATPVNTAWPRSFTVASAPPANTPRGTLVLFGTSAGASDVGRAVINLVAGTTVHIYPRTGIAWAAGLHVTITDEIAPIGGRIASGANGETYLDLYQTYSGAFAQMSPVPVMGGDAVVEIGKTHYRNGGHSWHPLGTQITAWQWACPGASITGAATSVPTMQFSTAGNYRLSLTVTAGGVSTTSYRRVLVVGETNTRDVAISNISASRDGRGYSARLLVYGEPIPPLTRVALYAVERYGGTVASLGQVLGCENVVLSGFVSDKDHYYNETERYTECTLEGWQKTVSDLYLPQYQIERVLTATTSHLQILNPDLRKMTWWLSSAGSNVAAVMDVWAESIQRGCPTFAIGQPSALEAFNQLSELYGCLAGVDRYGRLSISEKPELSAAPLRVMDVNNEDIFADYEIREPLEHERAINLTAVSCPLYGNPTNLYSIAPGIANTASEILTPELMTASSQDEANLLAGKIYAAENNLCEIKLELAQNNRLLGIFPAQAIRFANIEYYPLSITDNYDSASGSWTHDVTARRINPPGPAETGSAPVSNEDGDVEVIKIDDYDDIPTLPTLPPIPPDLPEDPTETKTQFSGRVVVACDNAIFYTDNILDPLFPNWMQASVPAGAGQINRLFAFGNVIYAASRLGIWQADMATMTFSKLISLRDIEKYYNNEPNFYSCGVDDLTGVVLAVAGVGYGYGNLGHLYIAENGNISKKTLTHYADMPFGNAIIRTANGELLASYHTSFDSQAVLLSVGSGYTEARITLPGGMNGYGFPVCRKDAPFWLYRHFGSGLLGKTSDNVAFVSLPVYAQRSFDYLDSRIAAIDNYFNLRYTDDYGVTQQLVTMPTNFYPGKIHMLSSDAWLAFGRLELPIVGNVLGAYYTDDAGATWWPKYSNLPEITTDNYIATTSLVVEGGA